MKDRSLWAAVLIAVLGWPAFALTVALDPQEAARAYLTAFLWVSSFPLGALAFLMIFYAVGGRWGSKAAPLLRDAALTTPLLMLYFLALGAIMGHLYAWARPEVVAVTPLWQHRSSYLNTTAFVLRGLGFLAVWTWLAWKLRRLHSSPEAQKLACAGLVFHMLATGSLSVDWVLSLELHFRSSIFGWLFMTLQALTGLAWVVFMVCYRSGEDRLGGEQKTGHLYDLGGLLLVLVMLTAYLSFSQLVIIYSGNLPAEIGWLKTRVWGAWGGWALGLLLLQLFGPFLFLTWGAVKRDPRKLGFIAALVLLLSPLHFLWLVVPSFHPHQVLLGWSYPAAFWALGATWWAALSVMRQRRLERTV